MTSTRSVYELRTINGQMYVVGTDAKDIKRCEWVGDEGYGRKLVEYRNSKLA